jgi:hypothetical protein
MKGLNVFNIDDRVVFVNLPEEDKLFNQRGSVVGLIHGLDEYCIVLLDEPYMGNKAILMTQYCLKLCN